MTETNNISKGLVFVNIEPDVHLADSAANQNSHGFSTWVPENSTTISPLGTEHAKLGDDFVVSHLPTKRPVADTMPAVLTREELLRLDETEPRWRLFRKILFMAILVLFLVFLVVAIVLILVTPKCPYRPKQEFWQSKVGYWVNPFAFKDSDGNGVGDFKGIIEKVSYITDDVGAGYVVLSSILDGYFNTSLGRVNDFYKMDPILGTEEEFLSLIRVLHKHGIEVVVGIDLNAISKAHKWVRRPNFLIEWTRSQSPASRDSTPAVVDIGSKKYYSVGDKSMVDLNLKSDEVVQQMQDVLKHWLEKGLDGVLLSNAGFYVEDSFASGTDWHSTYPSGQLFTEGSVEFVKKMRETVKKASSGSVQSKVLIVDAGNTGYGIDDSEKALKFLEAADLIISRQFVDKRGWKFNPLDANYKKNTLESYNSVNSSFLSSLALVTATPSDPNVRDPILMAATLLLPGSPILFYGSELGNTYTSHASLPAYLFPKGKTQYPNLGTDNVRACNLPMPWNKSGAGFTSTNVHDDMTKLAKFGVKETVHSATSEGRLYTFFQMTAALVKLHKEPSLNWGALEILEASDDIELFVREADGFPPFIIGFVRGTSYRNTFDFSETCESIKPVVVYPHKIHWKIGESISSKAIFLSSNMHAKSVYVFQCA